MTSCAGSSTRPPLSKLRRGMPAEQAARAARVEMGSSNAVKHHIRSATWESRMEIFLRDLKYCVRGLLRSPGFTLIAVLSLALGIGANTAIFTLIKQVLLEHLPVRDPQQLVTFGPSHGGGILGGIDLGTADMFTYDFARQLEAESRPIPRRRRLRQRFANGERSPLQHRRQPLQIPANLVSGNFFDVLGAAPLLGRAIAPFDAATPDSNAVAVISHHFWQQSLSSDPAVIGKTISINATPFTVIGVMPEAFHGITQELEPPDIWVPITMIQEILLEPDMLEPRMLDFMHMVARRGPHSQLAADQAWLDRQIRDYVRAGEGASITPARQQEIEHINVRLVSAAHGVSRLRSRYGDSLKILMAIVAVVLLIACANLANFLLARAIARQREVATRLALGSSRGRIIRQSLLEALLLSLSGGVFGLALAFAATRALIAFVARGHCKHSAGCTARQRHSFVHTRGLCCGWSALRPGAGAPLVALFGDAGLERQHANGGKQWRTHQPLVAQSAGDCANHVLPAVARGSRTVSAHAPEPRGSGFRLRAHPSADCPVCSRIGRL